MKIKKITDMVRNDFYAVYVCEACGHEQKGKGYNDGFFHNEVVPRAACPKCGINGEGKTPQEIYDKGLRVHWLDYTFNSEDERVHYKNMIEAFREYASKK